MTPDNRADGALAEAWCQPMGCGKHTPRVFLIRFEDTEVGDLTFTDEGEARDMFVKLNQNWNCYLMASLPLIPRPAEPAQAAQVDLVAKLPRLTEAMIIAACKAHYGSKIVDQLGIDGIDLATEAREYTFRDGFKRMWSGVRAVIRAEAAEAALAAMTEREERLCRSLRHYMDLAHTGGTEADWFEAHDGATAALTQKGA